MAKFFMSPELELTDESINVGQIAKDLGYECRFHDLYYEIEENGLIDLYDNYPPDAIERLDVASTIDGYTLMGLWDTEDGPVALYLKRKNGGNT